MRRTGFSDEGHGAPMRSPKGHLWFGVTSILMLTLDLWSKHEAFRRLGEKEQYVLWKGVFGFQRVLNSGMMYGAFQNVPAHWWVLLRGLVCVAIIVLYFSLRDNSRLTQFAFGLVSAGALGNIYDNIFGGLANGTGLFTGKVRDFLWFHWFEFPTFNVADSCICVGAPLLLIILWRHDKKSAAA